MEFAHYSDTQTVGFNQRALQCQWRQRAAAPAISTTAGDSTCSCPWLCNVYMSLDATREQEHTHRNKKNFRPPSLDWREGATLWKLKLNIKFIARKERLLMSVQCYF